MGQSRPPWLAENMMLNLSVPHRISAAAAKTGGGRDAPGLLKLPRKAQLRTSLCLQVSGVRRPKARHDSEGSRRSADVTREEAAAAGGGATRKRKWCVVCL